MPDVRELDAFLLSREWRDGPGGVEITLWAVSSEHGAIKASLRDQEAVLFVPRDVATEAGRRDPRPLRTREGLDVDAVYFRSQRALIAERERLRNRLQVALESDVKPSDRFLMERFVTSGIALRGHARSKDGVLHVRDPQVRAADVTPQLRPLSLDIETDGWDGPVLSIALAGEGLERVLIRRARESDRDHDAITFHDDERALLDAAFDVIRRADPDLIVGWNVVEFDLRALQARCAVLRVPFAIGRAGERARVLEGATASQVSIARVPGRVVLDGIATLKNATWSFERYTLDHVARALVGRGKRIDAGGDALAEIRRMHAEDPDALAAYNLEDARLVLDVFRAADLVGFAVERARLTGLPLDRQGGAVAAFDHLYLPRLHRRGYVAPDVGVEVDAIPSPGGHVLESVPGLYRNVLSFDFRSLYPSIIRTFHVDPLGLWAPGDDPIPGFEGASFPREGAILPDIVAHLAEARGRAQSAKNEALSRAIKILMNSFYGVLGTPGCRFFDPRLATSITRRGHEIIDRSRAFFEERGHPVIYGDTDSLFVRLPESLAEAECRAEGARLAREITAYWRDALARELRLESFLEMRFESHYLRFLMPTMRHSDRGSKKRYAGLVRRGDGALELVIRGLEAIRSDWTPLAREVQRELLRRVFEDQPWEEWLRGVRGDLVAGKLDRELVYRRRLRREIEDYGGSPPHVRAARMLEDDLEGDEIEYVITTRGPEPASRRVSPIDHAHYVDKQLAPAADVVLPLLGTSFDRVAGAQLRLF
ncbi:DNA polymerase II [Sandaracinus amylolyticus]|uniref:DNA polymerase II n=1 Tax=Sandaracinus amylolyticus TaxID=927083 RepID=UPI001F025C98|nr:DNA polymerase II [Sandaracinus amylolyticus]